MSAISKIRKMKLKAFVVLLVISLKSLGLFAQPCQEVIDYSPNKLVEPENLGCAKIKSLLIFPFPKITTSNTSIGAPVFGN